MAEEKNFENKIKKFLKDNNIFYVKFFANGYTVSGIPDILACIDGKFWGIEVKAEKGKISALQYEKIQNIADNNGVAVVVYPSGFDELKKMIIENKETGKYILKNNKKERIS